MFLSQLGRSVLLVVSMTSIAQAYLVPGRDGGPARDHGQYQHGHGGQPGQDCTAQDNGIGGTFIDCTLNGGGGIGHGDDGWVDPGSGVDPSPYDPSPYDPNPGQRWGEQQKSVWLGRSVVNERLALRQIAGLDRQWSNWEVLSVRGNLRPNSSGRTIVQLVADGRVIAEQVNPGYQLNLIPRSRVVLDTTVRTLQLVVNGSTYIDDLQISLTNSDSVPGYPGQPLPPPVRPEPPPFPGQPGNPGWGSQRVDLNIQRQLWGNDRVDLTQYVNLSQYRGLAVESVEVQVRNARSGSAVNLLVNGNNLGHAYFNGGYSQVQSIWLSQRPVIGRGADSLVLYTSGEMIVERVTLVLSR